MGSDKPALIDEDDEDDDRADDFERSFNFRFELGDSAPALRTHARGAAAATSLRRKDETRKEKREARKKRKAAEKARKLQELRRLKNEKKRELERKVCS